MAHLLLPLSLARSPQFSGGAQTSEIFAYGNGRVCNEGGVCLRELWFVCSMGFLDGRFFR